MATLEQWFSENKRSFPWRENPTPYRVWISEIMLQQTRACVVVEFFLKWMKEFPDIESLYEAPLERVLKTWEGLGYYSRARNIHAAAKIIVEKFQGNFPSSYEELHSIPGFGPYTVGAVLNFAFHKKALAIDGNVNRVICRLFAIDSDLTKAVTKEKIRASLETLLNSKEPWITSEALIELGATVCGKSPKCSLCPLQNRCKGFLLSIAENLPVKSKEIKIQKIYRPTFVFHHDGQFLVKKNGQGIMADLWEFPFVEVLKVELTHRKILLLAKKFYQEDLIFDKKISEIIHSFTTFKAFLFPYFFKVEKKASISGYQWIDLDRLLQLPFSSGHKKLLNEVEKIYKPG